MTADTQIGPTTTAPPGVSRVTRLSVAGTAGSLVLVIVLAALPYVIGLATIYSLIDLFILVILATTWNLLAGFGGLVSIGQQAYIGVGAYGLVAIADRLGVNLFLAIPIVAVLCGLLALPISYATFRLVGGYFAVGTWVIAEICRLVTIQIPALGGGAGVSVRAMSGYDRDVRIALGYWIALACAVLVVAVVVLLVRSRLGLALTAIRDEPVAAATSGIDVVRAKRIVFVIAGAFSGIAGTLIAISTLNVQPDSVYSVQWSAFMIVIVVIGGVGTIEGPILGAVLFWALQQLLAGFGPLYLIGLGVVAVLAVVFVRDGLWGLASRRRRMDLFPVRYRTRAAPGRASADRAD